jgi:hypothetical protein
MAIAETGTATGGGLAAGAAPPEGTGLPAGGEKPNPLRRSLTSLIVQELALELIY